MKTLLILGSLLTAVLFGQTAFADHRDYRRGYDHYRDYGDYRSYRHSHRDYYSHSDYYGVNPYQYGYRRGSSFHFSYGDRYSRRHDHDAGYFVGGLVLGSLLSAPRYYEPRVERVVYRSAPVVTQREVVVVRNNERNTSGSNNQIASGRRLLRDLEGNCFERNVDEQGNEIRVQLQAQECNF